MDSPQDRERQSQSLDLPQQMWTDTKHAQELENERPLESFMKEKVIEMTNIPIEEGIDVAARLERLKEEDRKAKMWLLAINSVLISITMIAFIASIVFHSEVWFSDGEGYLYSMLIALVPMLSTFLAWCMTARCRWHIMTTLGFSREERLAVFHPRDWSFNIGAYQEKYSKIKLKITDGICRKSNHILTSLFNLTFIAFILTDNSRRIRVALIGQVVNIIASGILYRSKSILSYPFYGSSSRVRDGRFGRMNLMQVRFVSLLTLLSISSITSFFVNEIDEKLQSLYLVFIYSPTAVGDAAGEIIGSLFGKHQFKVYGIGEINKKSIEGTIAVFLGSIVPMLLVGISMGVPLPPQRWGLALLLSTQSTILELMSPRSSDNYTMPVANVLTSWAWIGGFGSF